MTLTLEKTMALPSSSRVPLWRELFGLRTIKIAKHIDAPSS